MNTGRMVCSVLYRPFSDREAAGDGIDRSNPLSQHQQLQPMGVCRQYSMYLSNHW